MHAIIDEHTHTHTHTLALSHTHKHTTYANTHTHTRRNSKMQGLSDNPAMGHVATGRVFDVQRQVWARVFHLHLLLRTLTFADMFAYYFLSFLFFFPLCTFDQGMLDPEHSRHRNYEVAARCFFGYVCMYVCTHVPTCVSLTVGLVLVSDM